MAISNEELKLTLTTSGASKAQQEIADLDAETKKLTADTKELTEAQSRLRDEQRRLREEGKKGTAEYKENAKAINDNKIAVDNNSKAIKENKAKTAELRTELGLAGMTYRQLTKEKQRLTDLRDNTVHGTQQWKDYNTQLGAVNARMGEVSGKAQQTSFSMGKLADGFNRYSAIALSFVAIITGITMSLQSLIGGNAKLSDSLADVSKNTNLTAEEVRQLNAALHNWDSRTTQSDLLALTVAAGKLGIRGKDSIESFVKSADKLQVALGGDLGGDAEETAKKVGKLVDVFKMKDTYELADAMERTGSVINELGSNSSASESYIVDFTTRLAGIAPNAKIAYTEVAGLAATLDSLGQTEEMAATAAGTLIMDMFNNTAEYANTAGMSVKDFSRLLNEDANSAMIAVLENIKGNNDGMAEMALRMQDLGIDGARATSVIGVLANNTETLRQQQTLANTAFEQNISLQAEFDKKNNNFAATLDKIGKRMASAFVSPAIVQGLEAITNKFYDLIKVTEQSKIEQERDRVLSLAGALTDSNLKLDDRKKILTELQGIAPEVAANLDAENLNYKTLADNVNKYNENVIRRIQLENLKDSQKDALQDYAELQMERAKLVAEANRDMMKDFSDIASREGTVQERLKATLAYIEEMKRKYAETSDMSKGFGGGKSVEEMREIQRISSKTLALTVELNAINNKEAEIKQAEIIKTQSEQYVEELKKILGLSTEIKQVQTGTKLPDAPAGDSVAPVSKADRKEAAERAAADKKMAEESMKRYRELLRQRELDNMNALDREIGQINDRYNAEIEAYKFSAAQIDDLNNARQAEIDQARVRNREVVMQEDIDMLKNAYDAESLVNDQAHFEAQQDLINSKQMTADELLMIDQQYADEQYALELAMLEKQKKILQDYGKSTTNVERQILELHKRNTSEKDRISEAFIDKEKQRKQEQIEMALDLSAQIGEEFGRLIGQGERDLQAYMSVMLRTILRTVKNVMQASIAQATISSMASAESVATWGEAGIAKAAVLTALIEGAFTAFEASVGQYADGRYDVIGAQDGKPYRNVPYSPRLSTGVVNSPVLVGELPEVVWDTKTTRNIMLNAPWLIDEMNRYRVPQRATGEYSSMPAPAGMGGHASASNDQLMQMIAAQMSATQMLMAKLDDFNSSSIRAHVVLGDLQEQQKYYNNVNNRISLRS